MLSSALVQFVPQVQIDPSLGTEGNGDQKLYPELDGGDTPFLHRALTSCHPSSDVSMETQQPGPSLPCS